MNPTADPGTGQPEDASGQVRPADGDGPDRVEQEMMEAVGEEIVIQRTRKKWSQERLAKETGYDKKTIGRLERGERAPTIIQLHRISKALGIMPAVLTRPIDKIAD
ncbi:helix-turn-helix transcriptional regulator [Nocardia cyriacigeorgica]|uniref:helix-turn-helix transcriptional regulator n=1 Tax=Nocardia cyriacigeorgica TaxID=135487 RepID=UPI0013BBACAE|nr:helix-turn-helix transcriptional regulator [Nocardia cyriacigeorgica]NEW49390.1 helix-turn-helix transcriptional regulator [Nocardia cyriacigeorgica]